MNEELKPPRWLQVGQATAKLLGMVVPPRQPAEGTIVLKLDSPGDVLLISGLLKWLAAHGYGPIRLVVERSSRKLIGGQLATVLEGKASSLRRDRKRNRFRLLSWLDNLACCSRLLARPSRLLLVPSFSALGISHFLARQLTTPIKCWFAEGETVDFDTREITEGIYNLHVEADRRSHEIDKALAMLQAMGAGMLSRADIWPDIGLTDSERAWARSLVSECGGRGAEGGGQGDVDRESWIVNRRRHNHSIADPATTHDPQSTTHHPRPTPHDSPPPRILRLAVCAGARYKQKDWGFAKFAELLGRLTDPEFLASHGYATAEFLFLGEQADWENNERIMAEIRAAEPQSGRASEPQSGRATEQQGSRASEQQSSRASEAQSSRAAEPQSGRATEQQSSRAAEQQESEGGGQRSEVGATGLRRAEYGGNGVAEISHPSPVSGLQSPVSRRQSHRAAEPQKSEVRGQRSEIRATEQQSSRAAACHGAVAKRSRERQSHTPTLPHSDTPILLNLAGKTTIRQSVAVIAECDLCVGNDTFGLHAAISEHTPSVVILGRQEGDRWGPWGDPRFHRAATLPNFACEKPSCGWNCPFTPYKCVAEITVDQAFAEIEQVLAAMQDKSRPGRTWESAST